MKLQVFAIKDRAIAGFMQPFFAHTIGAAVRAFQDGMNDPQTPMAKHPEDYDLWHLGEWDDQTGDFYRNPGTKNMEVIWPQQIAIGKNMIHTRQ